MTAPTSEQDLRVAVVTGAHEYDVVSFHRLFRELPGLDCYPQSLEDFATDAVDGWRRYDAVTFFNCHQETPGAQGGDLDEAIRSALDGLIAGNAGVVLLHHAILCYPEWRRWTELSGLSPRVATGSAANQRLRITPAACDHPITRGVDAWDMIDEIYEAADAGDGSQVLLTTDHPMSMRTIAWTRERANGRTFCFQSGHDDQTWTNASFRAVLRRGIAWSAGGL